jgi:hypothetical protein
MTPTQKITTKLLTNRKISLVELRAGIKELREAITKEEQTKATRQALKILKMPIQTFMDRRGIRRPFDLHKVTGAVSQDGNKVHYPLVKNVIDIKCLEQERVEFIRSKRKY